MKDGAAWRVPLTRETVAEDDLRGLSEWMTQGHQLTKGPETVRFESEFAAWQGRRYAVFANSGSSANLLMIDALKQSGRLRNLRAIAPGVSWVTTVAPLLQLGFDVSLCDCDRENLGLDVGHLERLIVEKKPSLVILVHVLGHANHMQRILELCEAHGAIVLEDACEALGSSSRGRKLGSFGTAGAFSFYYGHQMSTLEGGMVVTDDAELQQTMLSLRSHGWSRDLSPEQRNSLMTRHGVDEARDLYTFYYAGYNFRSTDLQAHLGRLQLRRLDEVVTAREQNFHGYRERLAGFFCQQSETERISSLAYGTLVSNRLEVFRRLRDQQIETRPLICGNIGLHPFWFNSFGPCSLPNADVIHNQGLYLPNFSGLTGDELSLVSSAFLDVARPGRFQSS